MAEDFIRYDILTQDALRGVVRKVLAEAAKTGLPGEHHFYVSFDTTAPGVRISSRLLAQYPEEITIVIQHQFWDLKVSEHSFEIELSFDGTSERLLVPFNALKGFLDPSVKFGLQFQKADGEGQQQAPAEPAGSGVAPAPAAAQDGDADVAPAPAAAQDGDADVAPAPAPAPAKPTAVEGQTQARPEPDTGRADGQPVDGDGDEDEDVREAEVVSLDAFRKK